MKKLPFFALLALAGCASIPHPLDCATGLVAWANCAPGTKGYFLYHQSVEAQQPPAPRDDDAQCKSYGAVPGTDVYVHCRISLNEAAASQSAMSAQARQADQERRRALIMQMLQNNRPYQLPAPTPVPQPKSTNCATSFVGDQAYTTCH